MRGSQATAAKYNIRVNALAPFFTPTHMMASFTEKWKEAGLEANTTEGVAEVVAHTSLDERSGRCILVTVALYLLSKLNDFFMLTPFLVLGLWELLARAGGPAGGVPARVGGRGRVLADDLDGQALC